jgi:thiamine biosynthesis protein ThiS
MHLVLNGQSREFSQLAAGAHLQDLIVELNLKGDRLAIEHNGNIVPRAEWTNTGVAEGDRLEIVHFVGGGSSCIVISEEPQDGSTPEIATGASTDRER